jgi:hypothetical protein
VCRLTVLTHTVSKHYFARPPPFFCADPLKFWRSSTACCCGDISLFACAQPANPLQLSTIPSRTCRRITKCRTQLNCANAQRVWSRVTQSGWNTRRTGADLHRSLEQSLRIGCGMHAASVWNCTACLEQSLGIGCGMPGTSVWNCTACLEQSRRIGCGIHDTLLHSNLAHSSINRWHPGHIFNFAHKPPTI